MAKPPVLIGQKFGLLLVIDEFYSNKYGKGDLWCLCQCDCGNQTSLRKSDLLHSKTKIKSCGCYKYHKPRKDYVGMRFGKLVVLERLPKQKGVRKHAYFLCQCDCGKIKEIFARGIVKGETKSCGCLKEEPRPKGISSGEKNPNWKGGVTKKNIPLYDSYAHKIEICEEVRRCPENPDILEVKCTYCGRWIVPTTSNVCNRLSYINGNSIHEARFYCSGDGCRKQCPIFQASVFPKGYKPATSREVQPELRQLAFARDDYTCQRCGATENLHCHHIEGININPLESADVDLTITVCKSCHKEIHQQKDCRYIDLQCKKEENYENIS